MKTTQPKTPEEIGLSIIVCSGPRGVVRDENWPCIEYTLQLQDSRRRPIWTGEYRLGVGHVKVPKGIFSSLQHRMSGDEESLLMTWQSKPHAQFVNKQRWADVAAKLAASQKVTPKLMDVCHSLLADGAAFFDGQRFDDWAGDFGYSADSIKAKETFEACDRVGRDLSRALSRDEIESLREWAGNY
jgi:hypothetical protein